MIERERLQHQALLAAAAELGADGARILLGDADSLLAKAGDWRPVAGFDVVFLDPPYNKGLVQKTVQQLLELGLLRTEALLYIESELDWEALSLPVSIQQLKSTRAGSVNAFLARYRPEVAE